MALKYTLNFLISVLSIYSLLIFLRVILSLFIQRMNIGQFWNILIIITEPYLRLFRKIRFLKISTFDLTPAAALISLSILQIILRELASISQEGFSIIKILLLSINIIWMSIAFLLFIYLVLVIVRVISLIAGSHLYSPVWQLIDHFLSPISRFAERLFKNSNYMQSLIIGGIFLIILLITGNFLINLLIITIYNTYIMPV